MFNSIQSFTLWLKQNNISPEDVEMYFTFKSNKIRSKFYYAVGRELGSYHLTNFADQQKTQLEDLSYLTLFGMRIRP